ncbi:alpha/beta fold hydrolase [Mycobacterium asiaticum]|uniref:alpha/beta fold hydrolase n=1 Tax=Mycobacterium asiaticum TaxID=1790 RepID=UPI001E5FB59D|nr:alpha/beta fold hydrolase [Mycobacterium asiaticum]
MDLFARHGYDVVAPGWPNEPATVAEAREHPERVANLGIDAVVQHFAAIAAALPEPPVVIGHSFGGLIAQKLLDLGYARAAVAIDPAQIKGVKPLPLAQLRSSFPVLGNPASKKRAVSLTAKQFRYGFGNAIDWAESDALYDRYTIPSPAAVRSRVSELPPELARESQHRQRIPRPAADYLRTAGPHRA